MVRRVNETPALPRGGAGANQAFDALLRALFLELSLYAYRLNRMAPKDGSEGPITLASYAIANLPDASGRTGAMVYVTDDVGGAVPAFSDGTDWRRVTDRAVVSTT